MATITGDNTDNDIDGTSAGDSISALGGDDTVTGGQGADSITGGGGDDFLSGNGFSQEGAGALSQDPGDLLNGGGGDDHLVGGNGDHLDGGVDTDSFEIWLVNALSEPLDLSDLDWSHFMVGDISLDGFESGVINLYNDSDDHVDLGETLGLVVRSGDGDDTLVGGSGYNEFWSGYGHDLVQAGDGGGLINTSEGDDTVYGGAGEDHIDVGGGFNGGFDKAFAGGGDDFVSSDAQATLDGGEGIDTLELDLGRSTTLVYDFSGLGSGAWTDGVGADIQNFENGLIQLNDRDNDVRLGASSGMGFVFQAQTGEDTVLGGAQADSVVGGSGHDVLLGRGGDDTLEGSSHGDTVIGGRGNDDVRGGSGRDRLDGGDDADLLTGGADRDYFMFKSAAFIDGDTITDLEDNDRINLQKMDADTATAGDQDFTLIEGEFTETAGELRLEFDGTNTLLQIDIDGDGAADATVILIGDQSDYTNFAL